MKFLIIEDDNITSMVLQELLNEFGESDLAEDGLIGLELIEKKLKNNENYDVVYLDIMLPQRSGQDILTDIRDLDLKYNKNNLNQTKVIMSTALDDYNNIKTAFNNSCEAYIVKPFDKDKIMKALIDLELIYNFDEDEDDED